MKFISKLLIFSAIIFSTPALVNGDESSSTTDRLTYNESIDPTTAFLFTGSDYSKREQMAEDVCDYARKFLGRPYVWGGKGPKVFDCSGFTSYVYRNFDISLSPSAIYQATQGKGIDITEARPGDLMFFTSPRRKSGVGHVAMVVDVADDGTITFIHASTKRGITYNKYPQDNYYKNAFLFARRVLD